MDTLHHRADRDRLDTIRHFRFHADGIEMMVSNGLPPSTEPLRTGRRLRGLTEGNGMRRGLSMAAGLFLWMFVFADGTSAQRQIQLYATIVDSSGAPASSVAPEDVRVTENDVEAKVLKVEPVEWTTKVQILLDTGGGVGSANLNQLRNGVRGLIEALPPGLEMTLVTTAPQPRIVVRATTDRQALLAGIDKISPDSGAGRFVESLNEALQRFERDTTDFFGIVVSLGTTMGDNRVPDRDVNQIFERAQKKPTTVHVVMLSAGSQSASGGVVQQEVGMQVAKMTNGRYEGINVASRIATLLPEIGAQIAKSNQGASKQFRITAERPGNSNEPSKISMSARNGKVVTSVTVGSH